VRRARVPIAFAVQWAILVGVWFLFVGHFAWGELAVGAFAATVATIASYVVWGANLAEFYGHGRAFAQAWRLPWLLLKETVVILAVLARHLFTAKKAESLMRAVRYDAVADTPRDATLRALAIGYCCVAPNTVVLGIDRDRRLLVLHQIQRAPVSRMMLHLGARP
jgi:multisubunit Na+/H+ antiporter MnhE subunit